MYARSGYAKMHAQFLELCKIYACRSCQRSWNNFLAGIFLTVLKLFQNWNIIPYLSTNGGIMVFQLFQAASTRLEYYSKVIQNIAGGKAN
jgi:hypothetical protein